MNLFDRHVETLVKADEEKDIKVSHSRLIKRMDQEATNGQTQNESEFYIPEKPRIPFFQEWANFRCHFPPLDLKKKLFLQPRRQVGT